jgi:hypothetical protein
MMVVITVLATLWLILSVYAAVGLSTGGGVHVGPVKEIPVDQAHGTR